MELIGRSNMPGGGDLPMRMMGGAGKNSKEGGEETPAAAAWEEITQTASEVVGGLLDELQLRSKGNFEGTEEGGESSSSSLLSSESSGK